MKKFQSEIKKTILFKNTIKKVCETNASWKAFPDFCFLLQKLLFCTGAILFQYNFITGSTNIDVVMLQTKSITCNYM